jgi:hypothetical protein
LIKPALWMMHSLLALWSIASKVRGAIIDFAMPFSLLPVGQLGHLKLHAPKRSMLKR